jgi:hypothetical protein
MMRCFAKKPLHKFVKYWQAHCHDQVASHRLPTNAPFSSYCIPQPVKNFDVVLVIYSLAGRIILMVDNTFMMKKTVSVVLTLL